MVVLHGTQQASYGIQHAACPRGIFGTDRARAAGRMGLDGALLLVEFARGSKGERKGKERGNWMSASLSHSPVRRWWCVWSLAKGVRGRGARLLALALAVRTDYRTQNTQPTHASASGHAATRQASSGKLGFSVLGRPSTDRKVSTATAFFDYPKPHLIPTRAAHDPMTQPNGHPWPPNNAARLRQGWMALNWLRTGRLDELS